MKHARHHQVLEHEGVKGIQRGDVSSWARGRSMPAINTSKKLEPTPTVHLRAADRDSLAAAAFRKQRIEKRIASEHEKQIEEGLREAKALANHKPKAAIEKTPTQKVSDFFDGLYAANIARTQALNAAKSAAPTNAS